MSHAADSTGVSLSQTITGDAHTVVGAVGHVFSSPFHWETSDWLNAGGIVVGSAAASLLDNDALGLMNRNRNSLNDNVQKIVVDYGSGITGIVCTGGLYIAGLLIEDQWLRETAVLMGSALVSSVAIELAGKLVIGRARPYTGLGNHFFKPFSGKGDFVSLPSGHTTVAFTLSSVLAARIRDPWVSIGLYCLAGVSSVSRMYSRDHWLSDVVAAASFSTMIARSVVHWHDERHAEEDLGIRVIPTGGGVLVVWRF